MALVHAENVELRTAMVCDDGAGYNCRILQGKRFVARGRLCVAVLEMNVFCLQSSLTCC